MAGKKNPWGGGKGGDDTPETGDNDSGKSGGPRNPWLPGGGGSDDGKRRSANIEDIFKNRGPEGPRRGGGGGGPTLRLPQRPGGKSWAPIVVVAVLVLWLAASSVHFIQPREQGIVTWLGSKYARTLSPGTNPTLPWPIQTVAVENVSEIRRESIGDGGENLILTGDQNLVDLSYIVRWNIKNLVQYRFQLAEPDETLREVAESAMRAAVAETSLDTVLSGSGRESVEARVSMRMQEILDAYGAGIAVQGVEIARTEAPEQVIEAFNDVLAARQDAERNLNEARRFEQQQLATAQGDAAEFNEIYEQYRLAPEVTRRRLYYETMEQVLSKTDKTVIGSDGVQPYLPLNELQRRQNQTPTPTTQQGGQ
ncbi:protease modulator HflK [uncultured Erythrobacter sp.]|uniref:protease modulator HflK n=1 Tax=uncultured Erythrobacter sp. TaxID=263913 RepID=UPI002602084B|nr:protease modulator HflK [uncultured Erythrobacter sp.]